MRDLRDGAANDQTHLLAGGDVRRGTSEPFGLAKPADMGTAGMAAGFGHPQQQWLMADPLPYEQPRALQVEVAACKLVMTAMQNDVASSLVLARDADCARRQQTRSLSCATFLKLLG